MPAGTGRRRASQDAKPIDSILEELKKQRTELNDLDDRVSNRIAELEAAFRTLGLGVRISTTINFQRIEGSSADWVGVLAFAKHAGKWRFVVESGVDDDPESWKTVPLLDCTRDLRAEALERHIPALLTNAVKELRDRIEKRQQGLVASNVLLGAITQSMEREGGEK